MSLKLGMQIVAWHLSYIQTDYVNNVYTKSRLKEPIILGHPKHMFKLMDKDMITI